MKDAVLRKSLVIVHEIVEQLRAPLTNRLKKDGWTVESQRAMLKFFRDLQLKLESNTLDQEYYITRGLDSWGITQGGIFEKSAKLTLLINSK